MLLNSCQKDVDSLPPDVTILSPGIDLFHDVGDTIYVQARATDDTQLEWMRFELVNDAFNPVTSPIMLTLNGSDSGELSRAIIISNPNLPSGTYYFKVTAYDGKNIGTAFRRTMLNAIPLTLEDIFLLRKTGVGSGIIERLTSDEWQIAAALPFSPSFAAINSQAGEIAISESMGGSIHWLTLTDFSPSSTTEFLSDGNEEFWTDVDYFEEPKRYSCGSTDGFVRLFKPGGNDAISAPLPQGLRAGRTILHEGFMLVETESLNQQNRGLCMYLESTGIIQQSVATGFNIVEMFGLDENRVLVIANQNGQGLIRVYDITGNGFEFPLGITAGQITCAASDGNGRFVFADDSGIRSFYFQGNELSELVGSINGIWKRIRYDKANLVFYALGDNDVILFDSFLQQYATWPCNESAYDILLRFNR
jgi:hypothetical protein